MNTENKLTVPVLKSNVVNLNDRMYTDEALSQIIEEFKQKQLNGVLVFGQLGYPDDFDTNLHNVSHEINDLCIEGDTLFAELRILDTPKGEELKNIIDNVVFRPRMLGFVNGDKTVTIKKFLTFDAIDKETDSYKNLI